MHRQSIIALFVIAAACPSAAQAPQSPAGSAVLSGVSTNTRTPNPSTPPLDTEALASARRERAESVQERTNGLWQSWLVSICEGCGPERVPYKFGDYLRRAEADRQTTGSVASAAPENRRLRAPYRSEAGAYADLSSERLKDLRRMP